MRLRRLKQDMVDWVLRLNIADLCSCQCCTHASMMLTKPTVMMVVVVM
jgi:hypothetical protein